MKSNSQTALILAHLRRGRPITAAQAYARFRCLRLAARIHDLRRAGERISGQIVNRDGKHYAEYRMARR